MYKSDNFLFRKVMLDGGNAMDSAIATMYCNTVVNSQSMGIGLFSLNQMLLYCFPRGRFHHDNLPGKWNQAGLDCSGDCSCSCLQGHVQWQCQPHTLWSVQKSGMKNMGNRCKRKARRSSGFWGARVCGGDLGAEAATGQPGCELGKADPALG